MEKEIGEEFLDKLLESLFQEEKSDVLVSLEARACELVGRVHPFEETFLE